MDFNGKIEIREDNFSIIKSSRFIISSMYIKGQLEDASRHNLTIQLMSTQKERNFLKYQDNQIRQFMLYVFKFH